MPILSSQQNLLNIIISRQRFASFQFFDIFKMRNSVELNLWTAKSLNNNNNKLSIKMTTKKINRIVSSRNSSSRNSSPRNLSQSPQSGLEETENALIDAENSNSSESKDNQYFNKSQTKTFSKHSDFRTNSKSNSPKSSLEVKTSSNEFLASETAPTTSIPQPIPMPPTTNLGNNMQRYMQELIFNKLQQFMAINQHQQKNSMIKMSNAKNEDGKLATDNLSSIGFRSPSTSINLSNLPATQIPNVSGSVGNTTVTSAIFPNPFAVNSEASLNNINTEQVKLIIK